MNKSTLYRTLAQSLASCPEVTADAALEIAEAFVLGIEPPDYSRIVSLNAQQQSVDAIVDAFRTYRRAKVLAPVVEGAR